MKRNRIIWGIVALMVLITIAVSFGTKSSHSQKANSNKSGKSGFEDLSQYPVADYEGTLPVNSLEREERILKNKRYDNEDWVMKNPHPDDSGVGRVNEIPPPPLIPTAESNLVVIGEITASNAYLSNDRTGIYSEYAVKVGDVLKKDEADKTLAGDSITADRSGGCVRYPNGQKVYYQKDGEVLPRVGSRYVLFLTTDKQSPNYAILTAYELKEGKAIPLDNAPPFRNLTETRESNFIETLRNKISNDSKTVKNQGKYYEVKN